MRVKIEDITLVVEDVEGITRRIPFKNIHECDIQNIDIEYKIVFPDEKEG
jgi:hypothetical protein